MLLATDAKSKQRNNLNFEFDQLLMNCSNTVSSDEVVPQSNLIYSELNWQLRILFYRNVLKWCISFVLLALMVYYIPILNWNVTALTRIVMIKLTYFWDWEYLYTEDCLIPSFSLVGKEHKYTPNQYSEPNCDYCENIDTIPRISYGVSGDTLESYLRYNQPIIIEKSHSTWELDTFIDFMLNQTQLANSVPCDLHSNILTSRSATLNEVLELAVSAPNSEGWFISFRNCDFAALKASRLLWNKPYYLPLHLKPFSTSWIVMSQRYRSAKSKTLKLEGLVIVAQLGGVQNVALVAKNSPCDEDCGFFELILSAGDALVFASDVWRLLYDTNDDMLSISFISEFEWPF